MHRHALLTALAAVTPLLAGLVAVAPASASPASPPSAVPALTTPATAAAPSKPVITEVAAGAPRTRAASSGERKALVAGTADAQVSTPTAIPPVPDSQSQARPTPSATSQVVQATGSPSFSLVGVTWTSEEAPGTVVSVRTTAVDGTLSEPVDVPVGDERNPSGLWGTDAVWTGEAVRAEVTITSPSTALPAGVVVNLIDPLKAAAAANPSGTTSTVIPASFRFSAATADVTPAAAQVRPAAYYPVPSNPPTLGTRQTSVPKPPILSRASWGADESLRNASPEYQDQVKALVVHHTAGTNDYSCSDVPAIIRGIYAYDTQQLGWDDIAYNYLIDKCGTIWESAAGGVASSLAVTHAGGFNNNTQAVVLMGNYDIVGPSAAMVSSLVKLLAW
ncbi:MAG: N-acetylmuramoyl-L-alanine amidase, partial [Mycobacteriaceae bacterium]